MTELPGGERSLTIYHLDTVHEHDRRTDTGRHLPRLRIASRGKRKLNVGMLLLLVVPVIRTEFWIFAVTQI